ncbi:MAG TPA: ribosome rescue protein RqcH [Candidatus Nitrosotenuis sp.]|nr:ribosome rescue protein RqcH [Candidatus Nitrosotenuis sp.]
MALAGIEITYLVNNISEKTNSYYVNNIYPINQSSILLKLHHPEKPDLFLVISSIGMWLTSIKIEPLEENKLVKRLRSDLLRLKLTSIEQIGIERVAYLRFAGFDKEFVLICEFFGDGNIMICNKDLKILALLHSIEVRHRELHVGTTYTPPPQKGKNIFGIEQNDFVELKSISTPIVKWFGRTFGLPSKYAEEILRLARIDFEAEGKSLNDADVSKIIDVSRKLCHDIVNGNHHPVIAKSQDKLEVFPIEITVPDIDYEEVPTFMEGLDKVFSKILLEKGEITKTSSLDKKINDLQLRVDEQDKAVLQVKEKSEKIAGVAKTLFSLTGRGVSTINDPLVIENLKLQNAELINEKGIPYLKINEEKVQIRTDASIPAIASSLFDESKKQAAAIESIELLKAKNQKEITKLKSESQNTKKTILFTEFKKKEWFERYRWFYTSDDLLAIGGRDSSSNSAIIRKQLVNSDKVFHAEIFGSPFFILKNPPESIPFDSLNEVAQATVCFSRAWREAMYGMSAYWVNPEQVKKAAPSGQFLAKGAFILEGHKNFIRVSNLKLAVGIMFKGDHHMIACGPPDPIKKSCICYAVIEPGESDMTDVAKKIRLEFIKLDEDLTKQFTIDDFVRVLPAGTSHITDIGLSKIE